MILFNAPIGIADEAHTPGFEVPDAGEIEVAGRLVSGPGVEVPPERRRIGMVFQDYALFPHMTVRQNVEFGLNGWNREARAKRGRV